MAEKRKPIGALCITPAVIARVLDGARVTIGQDKDTAAAIEAMGGHHEQTRHGQVTVDEKLNLVTSPCYMLEASIIEIAEDASNMVTEVLRRAG